MLKHRVRNEQTSGEKKSPSKGVLIYYFFPAHMQIFRPIGHTFGSRRERVKQRDIGIFMYQSAVVYCCCVLLSVVGCSCVLLCVVAC